MTTAVVPTGRVRVINAAYAERGPTSVKRAIAMVLRGDAVISEIDPSKGTIRAENLEFPWPVLIKLLTYAHVPLYVGPAHWSKAGVRKRDDNVCAYCGGFGDTVDHILDKDHGGLDTWENTVCCCSKDNAKKRNRTPEQAGMSLLFQPTVPTRIFLTGGKRKRKRIN